MKRVLTLTLAAGLIFSFSGSFAAALKVGVVNIQKVIAASPQAKSADASFKKQFAPRQAKIKSAAQDLQTAVQDFQRNASVMSDKQKQEKEEALTKQRDVLQQQQSQFQQDAQTAQAKMMKAVFAKIKTAVNQVAAKGGYDVVLQSQTVAYFKNKYDITSQVIKQLQ